MEIKLGPVKHVDPNMLKDNPLNDKYFRPVTGAELDTFAEDIRSRGVINPLFVKQDNTILAGHRRKMCAIMVKCKTVPIQYVLGEMTEEQEIAFILKDNLFRRHLTPEERRLLYKQVCSNFEERVVNKNSRVCGISAEELSKKTGISSKTIGYDLSAIRKEKEKNRIDKSVVDIADERAIAGFKKAVAQMLNISNLGSLKTCNAFLTILKDAKGRVESNIQKIEIRENGK
jgi:hypothetical protein